MRPGDAVSPLRIRLLGPFEVALGGQPLARLRFRKSQAVLALLALRSPASGYPGVVEREWLAGLLWPDTAPAAALHSLRNCLSDLRSTLGAEAARLRSSTVRNVALDLTGAFVDVLAFDAALARGDPQALTEAIALYRGPLLEGWTDAWIFQERQAREQGCLAALESLAALAQEAGTAAEAERHLRQAAALDPLREGTQRALMQALAAGGNYAAALHCFRELRLRLHRELNAEPDPETQALFRRLREEARQKAGARRPISDARHPAPDAREVDAGRETPAGENEPLRPLAPGVWRLLSVTGETRFATVLFAERSRSVEVMHAQHPEESAALVSRLLGVMGDAILKLGGQVDRCLGDGVLAIFGVAPAREDDAERAIRAALSIREEARCLGMEVAIGVASGAVYLAGAGYEACDSPGTYPEAPSRRPGVEESLPERYSAPARGVLAVTVAGAVVSLASRLQREADPGEILVGEGTYRQTRRAFEFRSRSLSFEGLAHPVTAHSVERTLPRAEKARGIEGRRAALIGREEELAKLKAVLAELAHGRGQMVSLLGEAGVGKSRLVAELKQQGMRDEGRGMSGDSLASSLIPHPSSLVWLEGRCFELSATTGYSVFIDLFRDYFGWRLENDARARGERLAAWLKESVSRGDLAGERAEEIGPLLGNLLAARFGTDWDERLQKASPEQIQYQTFLAVRDFLIALTHRQPLLLVLEDLHWADRLSLSLISLLMESLSHAPMGMLCIYRSEREAARLQEKPHGIRCSHLAAVAERKCPERLTEIRLRELTPEQSADLVAALLPGSDLPGTVHQFIRERSHGNPFFVEELVRSLIDARWIYRDGDRWRAGELNPNLPVPESIQSVILSRCDRLRPELQHVLQHAAVVGRAFQPRLLEAVVAGCQTPGRQTPAAREIDAPSLASALSELEDRALIYEERVVPEAEYSFRHVLMQETIYQSLLRRRRREIHQLVGEAMEALYRDRLLERYEQLAYHYERGTDDAKAVEYLLKAGEKARRAYLNEDAIGYFRRALERLDSAESTIDSPQSRMEWRLEARRGLGAVHLGMGKHEEAAEQFRLAVALGQEMGMAPPELAPLLFLLGDTLSWQGRADEMIGPAEEMLARLGEDTESVEAALMNQMAALGHRWRGDRARGLEYLRRNARFLRRLPYSEPLRLAYYNIATASLVEEDDVEAAAQWARALEDQARLHHDLRALGCVLELRSSQHRLRGDFRGAIPPLQQSLEAYRKIGGAGHQILCCLTLRELFLSLGQPEEAAVYADQQRQAAEASGEWRSIAVALMGIAKVLGCQGQWDRALEFLHQAAAVSGDDPYMLAGIAYQQGQAFLAQGKRSEALSQFHVAMTMPGPDPVFFVEMLSGLEEASNDPAAFVAFCRRFQAEHPERGDSPLRHWHLEPAQLDSGFRTLDVELPGRPSAAETQSDAEQDRLKEVLPLRPSADSLRLCGAAPVGPIQDPNAQRAPEIQNAVGWVWHDPYGDCSFTTRDGLEIRAANGRDLWHPDQSAPRLLREITGDFALQVVCRGAAAATPAIGGLLVWRNNEHYLRLDWGSRGPHQITLGGCLPSEHRAIRGWWGQKNEIIGRGRLVSDRIILRLERRGGAVRALCSADGEAWFTLGHAPFPSEGALQVGLHAIGTIQRTIYPGTYPDGTAIRFESLELGRDACGR